MVHSTKCRNLQGGIFLAFSVQSHFQHGSTVEIFEYVLYSLSYHSINASCAIRKPIGRVAGTEHGRDAGSYNFSESVFLPEIFFAVPAWFSP